jgi:hypothetical protein
LYFLILSLPALLESYLLLSQFAKCLFLNSFRWIKIYNYLYWPECHLIPPLHQ